MDDFTSTDGQPASLLPHVSSTLTNSSYRFSSDTSSAICHSSSSASMDSGAALPVPVLDHHPLDHSFYTAYERPASPASSRSSSPLEESLPLYFTAPVERRDASTTMGMAVVERVSISTSTDDIAIIACPVIADVGAIEQYLDYACEAPEERCDALGVVEEHPAQVRATFQANLGPDRNISFKFKHAQVESILERSIELAQEAVEDYLGAEEDEDEEARLNDELAMLYEAERRESIECAHLMAASPLPVTPPVLSPVGVYHGYHSDDDDCDECSPPVYRRAPPPPPQVLDTFCFVRKIDFYHSCARTPPS